MKPIRDNSTLEILSRFPESLYPGDKNYLHQVIRGYNICKRHTITILGLARDLGDICPYTISRINRVGQMFRDYRVLILENDSSDNTAHRLVREAKKNSRWQVITGNLDIDRFESVRTYERAYRMAEYRNRLMRAASQYESDYVILLDTDLGGGYSYDGIAHSFSLSNWDAIGSNGLVYEVHNGKTRRLFYDSWAFRRPGVVSAHLDSEINLLRLNRGEPPMPVKSCFGGLCIYKHEAYFCGAGYGPVNELGEPECDHVVLHTGLIERGFNNIYLNPSLITLYSKHAFMI